MLPDEEGFLYPNVEQEKCINCGLCEKTCPEKNAQSDRESDKPLACYAAIAKDM